MRILLLSRYTRLGASSRLRTMQYIPMLRDAGMSVQVAPLFDDSYLDSLYSGQKRKKSRFSYLLNRTRHLLTCTKPDIIWLEYEALPWIPWFFERSILTRGVPIVTDYDDAIFHRYDMHPNRLVRAVLGTKIARIMASSNLVVAGNPYLAEYATRFGASWIEKVPTVVDLNAYSTKVVDTSVNILRVGWIGTPESWNGFGRQAYSTLLPALQRHGAIFCAVGASTEPNELGTLETIPWTESSEVGLIQEMDIGVMPLPESPWARGKCGYKLIQYMACGLPVVASPVGVNSDIVEHGVNGFLARTDDEWREAVAILLQDAELRHRMGAAGRKKVEKEYSLQIWGPRMTKILRQAIENHNVGK